MVSYDLVEFEKLEATMARLVESTDKMRASITVLQTRSLEDRRGRTRLGY